MVVIVILRKGVTMLKDYPVTSRPVIKAANDRFKEVLEQSEKLLQLKQLRDRVALLEDLKLTNRLVSPVARSPFYGIIA